MYKLTIHGNVQSADGSTFTPDAGNHRSVAYRQWLAAGNTPDPYVAPVAPVPTVVDMAQARLALLGAGHLATVNAAISAMAGIEGDTARIEWEFRSTVRRDAALVYAMAAVLDLDATELDNLFIAAAAL